jgi:alkylation response protein AidB-like acyl-CoA dehydrogenase
VSEKEAMKVAEAARQTEWVSPGFIRELFLGNFRLDLIHPFPLATTERPEFGAFYDAMKRFLEQEVSSVEIDRTGEYPEHVVDGLRKLGAFGMKIPKEYGGLGFSNGEYQRIMQLLGTCDGNLSALLSAHQSIGVPQPLKLFGSKELKQKYLPRCAKGEISAFALTEEQVGSDPARLATTVEKTADGSAYVLNGEKLWCTNGTIAKLLVVMAKDPQTKKISAFVVETDWPGVAVVHRCRFMGLRALANAVISFTNVRVPVENLIGAEGRGLKIALTTLNDGRLSIPNGSVGTMRACLEIVRQWSSERVQWGKPVGRHEAITHKVADIAADTFAAEAMADLATQMSDRGGYDIRLEAAAAKEWISDRTWRCVDETMQIRGGRGYETELSLASRGEKPIGVERMMRDYRINKIFEGSSEIMHLFMAREAVDKHLTLAGALIDPDKGFGDKARAFMKSAGFYAWWYPTRWLGWGRWPRYGEFGRLAKHLRFVNRASRKLAREVFHGMNVYQAKLQNKQAFLFRLVDVANDLFAMAAATSRAQTLLAAGNAEGPRAVELADLFCDNATRRIEAAFHALWHNADAEKYRLGAAVLDGGHTFLEHGIVHQEHRAPVEPAGDRKAAVPIPVQVGR